MIRKAWKMKWKMKKRRTYEDEELGLVVTPLGLWRLQDKWANAATWENQGTQDKTRCRRRQSSHNSLSIWVEFLYSQIPICIVKDLSPPFIGARAGHYTYSRSCLLLQTRPLLSSLLKLTLLLSSHPPSFYIFLN